MSLEDDKYNASQKGKSRTNKYNISDVRRATDKRYLLTKKGGRNRQRSRYKENKSELVKRIARYKTELERNLSWLRNQI